MPPAFMMRSKPSAYYLIVVANSSSSSSAGKCQPDRLLVRKRDERRESNESSSLFHTTCGQPKPHSEAHRNTIGARQPDRTGNVFGQTVPWCRKTPTAPSLDGLHRSLRPHSTIDTRPRPSLHCTRAPLRDPAPHARPAPRSSPAAPPGWVRDTGPLSAGHPH